MVLALVKHSDDLLSFCKCDDAFATQGQAGCPWCGCGWLFSCARCRLAFTYAELKDVPETYEDIARIETEGFYGHPPRASDKDRMASEAKWQAFWGENAPVGKKLIFLDGQVLPADLTDFEFEGWTAKHSFDELPHNAGTKSALEAVFGNVAYWKERSIKEDPR